MYKIISESATGYNNNKLVCVCVLYGGWEGLQALKKKKDVNVTPPTMSLKKPIIATARSKTENP